MNTMPIRHETTAPSRRYATALLMDRSIGPRWMGTHSCSVHSEAGLNLSSSGVSAAIAAAGNARKRIVAVAQKPPHAFASDPKNVIRETASSSVYAKDVDERSGEADARVGNGDRHQWNAHDECSEAHADAPHA